jgi:four helix bundle protein
LWRTAVGKPGFLSLRVYRLSEKLADALSRVAAQWPEFHRNTVGEQLVRAADGIGANLAAGHGRETYDGNRRYVLAARAALYETLHWIRRAFRRELLNETQVTNLKPLVDDLGRRLKAYLVKLGEAAATNEG